MVNFKIGRKICVRVVFFSKKKSLQKVFFQVQKWSSFSLIFMKLGLPEKLGTLVMSLLYNLHAITWLYRLYPDCTSYTLAVEVIS